MLESRMLLHCPWQGVRNSEWNAGSCALQSCMYVSGSIFNFQTHELVQVVSHNTCAQITSVSRDSRTAASRRKTEQKRSCLGIASVTGAFLRISRRSERL